MFDLSLHSPFRLLRNQLRHGRILPNATLGRPWSRPDMYKLKPIDLKVSESMQHAWQSRRNLARSKVWDAGHGVPLTSMSIILEPILIAYMYINEEYGKCVWIHFCRITALKSAEKLAISVSATHILRDGFLQLFRGRSPMKRWSSVTILVWAQFPWTFIDQMLWVAATAMSPTSLILMCIYIYIHTLLLLYIYYNHYIYIYIIQILYIYYIYYVYIYID